MEILEPRQLLATVQWINPAGGSWDVASNWSTDAVPGSGDDVVINVSGASPTVTISSNVESVHSITAADPLGISGGGLTVAANSTISGGLTMTGGSLTASGSGVTLTVTGTTTVSGGSLYAGGGATLSLTEPDRLHRARGSRHVLQANGAGSVLSLPALATITTDTTQTNSLTQVLALNGGDVELPALTQVSGGPVLFRSNGTGGKLDIGTLTSLVGPAGQNIRHHAPGRWRRHADGLRPDQHRRGGCRRRGLGQRQPGLAAQLTTITADTTLPTP